MTSNDPYAKAREHLAKQRAEEQRRAQAAADAEAAEVALKRSVEPQIKEIGRRAAHELRANGIPPVMFRRSHYRNIWGTTWYSAETVPGTYWGFRFGGTSLLASDDGLLSTGGRLEYAGGRPFITLSLDWKDNPAVPTKPFSVRDLSSTSHDYDGSYMSYVVIPGLGEPLEFWAADSKKMFDEAVAEAVIAEIERFRAG